MTLSPIRRPDSPPGRPLSPCDITKEKGYLQEMAAKPASATYVPLLIGKLEYTKTKFSASGELATQAAEKLALSTEKIKDLADRAEKLFPRPDLMTEQAEGSNEGVIEFAALEEQAVGLRDEREELIEGIEKINDYMEGLIEKFKTTLSVTKAAIKTADNPLPALEARMDRVREEFLAKGLEIKEKMCALQLSDQ